MRVTVDVDDLVLATDGGEKRSAGAAGSLAGSGGPGGSGSGSGSTASALRLERARHVASSLDIRGARVDEALDALARYLDDAALAGLSKVLIIHGSGTGALRDAVRTEAGANPLVRSLRPGERGEGGDGATIIEL
jgi:DNA mismatch repair protein MutS2